VIDTHDDAPVDADDDRDDDTVDPERTPRPRWATFLAALCALTLAGALGLGYWLHEHSSYTAEEQDRADVVQATQVFVQTWNTFRPKDASSYVERVAPLLTTRFGLEFRDASKDVITGIVKQRLFSKGQVLSDGDDLPLVGISSIDGDSAEVLVVADATRVANRQRVLRHWRWQVSLDKVDGKWLVDKFEEV
jgi:hypothetical protein